MSDPSALTTVVFDFDGVVLESIEIKARAFEELFRAYPGELQRIVALHVENAGMSRYEKFRIIHRDIIKRPLPDSELERLGEDFSRIVFEQLVRCPFVAGAREFLERVSVSHRLYVASATPEDELRAIVERRGLTSLFRGVYGSPDTKAEILRRIVAAEGVRPEEVVFVGDATADYDAARAAGVHFVGRVPPGEPSRFPEEDVLCTVRDLHELGAVWDELGRGVSARR